MTHNEISLLLYLEDCLVQRRGFASGKRLDQEDLATAAGWTADGFLMLRRTPDEEPQTERAWFVRFSPAAWESAAADRRRRAEAVSGTYPAGALMGMVDRSVEEVYRGCYPGRSFRRSAGEKPEC
jgi:hypothetical protein